MGTAQGLLWKSEVCQVIRLRPNSFISAEDAWKFGKNLFSR